MGTLCFLILLFVFQKTVYPCVYIIFFLNKYCNRNFFFFDFQFSSDIHVLEIRDPEKHAYKNVCPFLCSLYMLLAMERKFHVNLGTLRRKEHCNNNLSEFFIVVIYISYCFFLTDDQAPICRAAPVERLRDLVWGCDHLIAAFRQ